MSAPGPATISDLASTPVPRAGSMPEAIARVRAAFPIPEYIEESRSTLQIPTVLALLQRHLGPSGRVLDFGSGPAELPEVLTQFGYDCAAADDLSDPWHRLPGMRDRILACAAGFGVRFEVLEDGKPWPWQPESFHAVMLHHVLEHIHDSPRGLLNGLVGLIRPGGLLIVTVPNAGNIRKRITLLMGGTNLPSYESFFWSDAPWRGHTREYVRADLAQMAAFLGLEVLELRGYHCLMTSRLPPALRPIYKGITALLPNTRDSWLIVARKPASWRARLDTPREIADRLRHKFLPTGAGRG